MGVTVIACMMPLNRPLVLEGAIRVWKMCTHCFERWRLSIAYNGADMFNLVPTAYASHLMHVG